jgi:hypothetical protein
MKRFLYQIFLFCIPILILIGSGEIYMRNRPSVYSQKRDQLLTNADSVELLILGNSHTTYGINPNCFTLYAYNLAFEDQTIYFDRKLLEKYLPILPRLKQVLITIDYHNLCVDHVSDRDFFYKYYFNLDYEEPKCFWKESLLQSFFVYSPEKTSILIFRDLKSGQQNAIGTKGWIDRSTSISDAVTSVEKNKMRAARFNTHIVDYDKNSAIIENFEWLFTTLKSKGIRPILITCPIYSTLRECLDKKILGKSEVIANSLAEKYGLQYLNYFYDDSFEVSDYYDSDHLNTYGAKKLTLKLDSVLREHK